MCTLQNHSELIVQKFERHACLYGHAQSCEILYDRISQDCACPKVKHLYWVIIKNRITQSQF